MSTFSINISQAEIEQLNYERFAYPQPMVELFSFFEKKFNKGDEIYDLAFFEITKKFLAYKYRGVRSGHGRSLIMYEMILPRSDGILSYRQIIWRIIDTEFNSYPDKFLELLNEYAKGEIPERAADLVSVDLQYLISIINVHLKPSDFQHCVFIHRLNYWLRINNIINEQFIQLTETFTNDLYKIYTIISWDKLRGKDDDRLKTFQDYELDKENEIRSSFAFNSVGEIESFFEKYTYLRNVSENKWNFNRALEFIIDENCKSDCYVEKQSANMWE